MTYNVFSRMLNPVIQQVVTFSNRSSLLLLGHHIDSKPTFTTNPSHCTPHP